MIDISLCDVIGKVSKHVEIAKNKDYIYLFLGNFWEGVYITDFLVSSRKIICRSMPPDSVRVIFLFYLS